MKQIAYAVTALACCVVGRGAENSLVLDGSTFPTAIAGAQWIQISNYAHDGGPGGIGVSYRSERSKADIYLYDAGDPAWLSKPLAERFIRETLSISGVMKEMERRKLYTNVKIEPDSASKSGKLTFVHMRFTYDEKGKAKKSHFHLAMYRGRLLKIRITVEEPVEDEMFDRAFEEAAAPFGEKA